MADVEATSAAVNESTSSRLAHLEDAVEQHQGALEGISKTMEEINDRIKGMSERIEVLEIWAKVVVCKAVGVGGAAHGEASIRIKVPQPPSYPRGSNEAGSGNKYGGVDHKSSTIKEDGTRTKEAATRDRSWKQGRDKGSFNCFFCGGPHIVKECPQRQKLNAIRTRSRRRPMNHGGSGL